MRVRKPKSKEHKAGSANITSLVDVALSLVIFFIVTLPSLLESGIFVKAPGVTKVTGSTPGDEFKASLYIRSPDGNNIIYILNDKVTPKEQIGPLIERLLQRSVSKLVIVRADGSVPYGAVVEMLDLAKQKNAQKLALIKGEAFQ